MRHYHFKSYYERYCTDFTIPFTMSLSNKVIDSLSMSCHFNINMTGRNCSVCRNCRTRILSFVMIICTKVSYIMLSCTVFSNCRFEDCFSKFWEWCELFYYLFNYKFYNNCTKANILLYLWLNIIASWRCNKEFYF